LVGGQALRGETVRVSGACLCVIFGSSAPLRFTYVFFYRRGAENAEITQS
jgi:hypothetical protein